jgi:hypothetical protein
MGFFKFHTPSNSLVKVCILDKLVGPRTKVLAVLQAIFLLSACGAKKPQDFDQNDPGYYRWKPFRIESAIPINAPLK